MRAEGIWHGRWICPADLKALAILIGGAIVTLVIPRGWDPAMTRLLARLYEFTARRSVARVAARMATVLPAVNMPEAGRLASDHCLMRCEDMWGRLRGMRRFGWRPVIDVEGIERVHAALARGRGVILWSLRFSSSTAIKQAFHRAGLPLVHVSAEAHGASSRTRFGIGVIASLYCRAENPYLAERVQIPLDGSLAYLNQLRQRLRDNACVSIFGEYQGKQNVEVEILGVRSHFALGAPSLAWLENSALFTAYAVRLGPCRYRVVIDEEVPLQREVPRKRFAARALAEYGKRLERLILAHPADWQGWPDRRFNVEQQQRL